MKPDELANVMEDKEKAKNIIGLFDDIELTQTLLRMRDLGFTNSQEDLSFEQILICTYIKDQIDGR